MQMNLPPRFDKAALDRVDRMAQIRAVWVHWGLFGTFMCASVWALMAQMGVPLASAPVGYAMPALMMAMMGVVAYLLTKRIRLTERYPYGSLVSDVVFQLLPLLCGLWILGQNLLSVRPRMLTNFTGTLLVLVGLQNGWLAYRRWRSHRTAQR